MPPETNTPQIPTTDMVGKSQEELDEANAILELPQTMEKEGREEMKTAEKDFRVAKSPDDMHKSAVTWAFGQQKVEEAEDLKRSNADRNKKLNEIVDNAEKNINPLQRRVRRESSDSFAKEESRKMKKLITKEDVQKTQDIYDNAYPRKVEIKITSNMQEQNKTPEEISKAIEVAKKTIDDAIEKEKSIPVTITPSPYTTPSS